jgi:hypothetical protein
MLSLQSFLRKGVSLGSVGKIQDLKDLKDDSVGKRTKSGNANVIASLSQNFREERAYRVSGLPFVVKKKREEELLIKRHLRRFT